MLIDPIFNLFTDNDVEAFCNFYKDDYYNENGYVVKDIMDDCFRMIDEFDLVLCLVDTPKYSCGMLLEVGYALAKGKSVVVCSRKKCEIDTLCQVVDENIMYESYDELLVKIRARFVV
mgnify:CR=1 FL=1